ncbi:A24 family peptidase [Amnibacterium soli]|uniref:Prepilin leader peptidase/N-methyltransferase n=1 Tax=Amnibacterium soli TaxID=1282736 RepID=A0ABP8Z8P1_9MICO
MPVLAAFALAMGLAIGSFLNVVIHRVPAGLSVVSPPSACPGCGHAISARDNVPILSWLLLRASCRHCSAPIAARYPVVEGLTGVLFVVVSVRFAPPFVAQLGTSSTLAAAAALEWIALLVLMAASVALAAIDLDVHRLPDRIVLPTGVVGAVLLGTADLLRGDGVAAATAAAGAGAAALLFAVLWFVRPGGMGLGDVKLAAVLGLFLGQLGVGPLVVGVAAGFLLGAAFGVALLLLRRATRRSGIPFGPWMLLGAWIGVLAGDPLAHAYLVLCGLA